MKSSLVLPHICYAMRSSLVLAYQHGATLSDLLLALAWGGGVGWDVLTSFGFRHRDCILPACRHDATLSDLLLALPEWGGVGCDNVSRLQAQGLCPNAIISSLALPHIYCGMRSSLVLHTDMMPRYQIFFWLCL